MQATSPPPGLISEYAFNYAAQSALIAWSAQFHQLAARTPTRRHPEDHPIALPLWDISLARTTGHIRPYVRALNLTDTQYQEIPGVPLQGRTIMAGAEFNWSTRR